MKNPFQTVRIKKPQRSLFDMSYENLLTAQFGKLYPIYLQEILPGDTFKVSSEIFMRTNPLISPIMSRINIWVHYFFVPNRLVWDNWETFITGGDDGTETATMPHLNFDNTEKNDFYEYRLGDYFGIQPALSGTTYTNSFDICALPFRAYALIWNEYYRDTAIQSEIALAKTDAVSSAEQALITEVQSRAWEKDYYTSARPWVQLGNEVEIPLGVEYLTETIIREDTGGLPSGIQALSAQASTGILINDGNSETFRAENIDASASGIDIIEMRNTLRLQEWLEKNARAGTRYIEQILSHFGVKSSDARLQRPEYLGGGMQPVNISEVLNTSDTTNAPQGNMAGHGVSVGVTNSFKGYFEEHGYVIGILSVVPRLYWEGGIPKHFIKSDKFDYYWPEFAQIGEQEIYDYELAWKTDLSDSDIFGYQQRYAEYKFNRSQICGEFRTDYDHWHLARSGGGELNTAWLEVDQEDFSRIFPTQTEDDYLFIHVYNNVRALRPIPYFGDPSINSIV